MAEAAGGAMEQVLVDLIKDYQGAIRRDCWPVACAALLKLHFDVFRDERKSC